MLFDGEVEKQSGERSRNIKRRKEGKPTNKKGKTEKQRSSIYNIYKKKDMTRFQLFQEGIGH